MKRIIKFVVVIMLCLIVLSSVKIFATGTSVVSVSSEKVAPGEEFYLILNLSSIKYNKFKVDISNNQSLVTSQTTGTVSNLASNGTVTTFTIDKSSVGLDKLGIVFSAPPSEGLVNFSVTITSLDSDTDAIQRELLNIESQLPEVKAQLESANTILSSLDVASEEYATFQGQITELGNQVQAMEARKTELETAYSTPSESFSAGARIEVSADAKSTDMKSRMGNKTLDMDEADMKDTMDDKDMMKDKEKLKDMDMMKDKMKLMEDNEMDMKSKMSNLQVSLKDASDKITSLSQGTTYQGSNNNYLSSLSVSGYELNNIFDKTTNDYFITVPENVNSIDVNATKEDSSAVVTIYGNTDLVIGQNKVIINVTAEDGSVRTYRIYVTK